MLVLLEENTIVKNCNGDDYKVIKVSYPYTLFYNIKKDEYVKGAYVKQYDDGIEWMYGKYYGNDLEYALSCF